MSSTKVVGVKFSDGVGYKIISLSPPVSLQQDEAAAELPSDIVVDTKPPISIIYVKDTSGSTQNYFNSSKPQLSRISKRATDHVKLISFCDDVSDVFEGSMADVASNFPAIAASLNPGGSTRLDLALAYIFRSCLPTSPGAPPPLVILETDGLATHPSHGGTLDERKLRALVFPILSGLLSPEDPLRKMEYSEANYQALLSTLRVLRSDNAVNMPYLCCIVVGNGPDVVLRELAELTGGSLGCTFVNRAQAREIANNLKCISRSMASNYRVRFGLERAAAGESEDGAPVFQNFKDVTITVTDGLVCPISTLTKTAVYNPNSASMEEEIIPPGVSLLKVGEQASISGAAESPVAIVRDVVPNTTIELSYEEEYTSTAVVDGKVTLATEARPFKVKLALDNFEALDPTNEKHQLLGLHLLLLLLQSQSTKYGCLVSDAVGTAAPVSMDVDLDTAAEEELQAVSGLDYQALATQMERLKEAYTMLGLDSDALRYNPDRKLLHSNLESLHRAALDRNEKMIRLLLNGVDSSVSNHQPRAASRCSSASLCSPRMSPLPRSGSVSPVNSNRRDSPYPGMLVDNGSDDDLEQLVI